MAPRLVSSGRLKCLAALAYGKLQLGPNEKEMLVDRFVPGKRSFKELTNAEADRVIDALKGMAGQVPTPPHARVGRRGEADVTALVTPAQRARLADLTRELIAAGLTPGYVEGVRLRACGLPFPRTSPEAERAIEALKAVQDRVAGGWRPESA